MSTIIAANISDGTDTVETSYVVNGSAKAWVNFNGTTSTTVSSSGVSSVTDTAVGKYSVAFSSTFSTVPSVTGGMTIPNFPGPMRVNPSTTTCQIFCTSAYASAYIDSSVTAIQAQGDLA